MKRIILSAALSLLTLCASAQPGAPQEVFTGVVINPDNKQLDEIGFQYHYRETGGGHTWGPWRIYLTEMSQMIFK